MLKNESMLRECGALFLTCALTCYVGLASAASSENGDSGRFALHAQATFVEQASSGFHAPYEGPHSLSPGIDRETADVTFYLGARLWPSAEIWLNPEIDQGFGLDNTLGAAGFPGIFDLSDVPNSEHLESGLHEFELDAEIERRHELDGRSGRFLVTVFENHGHMALLDDAVAVSRATGAPASAASVRRYRTRLGASLGLEQQLSDNAALYVLRARCIRTFQCHSGLSMAAAPAYNRDRGPVSIFALRLHAQL